MQFSVSQPTIEKALKAVEVAADPKGLNEMSGKIKINVNKDGKIALTCSSGDIQASDFFNCTVKEKGTFTTDLNILSSIIKSLSNKSTIEFSSKKEDRLIISSEKRVFEVVCMSDDSFPDISFNDKEVEFEVDLKDFFQTLKRVAFSMSNAPERYNLNGIFIEIEKSSSKSNVSLVATDGHRLSFSSFKISKELDMSGRMISKKAAEEIIKLLNLSGGVKKCSCSFSQNMVSIKIGSIQFVAKLLDATFPDYKKVIPAEGDNDKIVELETDRFLSEINVVKIVNKDEGSVQISISDPKISLCSSGTEGGNISNSELPCSANFTEKFVISYNPKYIIDVLDSLRRDKAKSIIMKFADSSRPSVLCGVDDDTTTYVVMPIKSSNL